MDSSPSTPGQRSSRHTTPKRLPLQERTPSQTNENPIRLARDTRGDSENRPIYATTPFPTKAAHVLLPSTIRNQRNAQTFDIFTPSSSSSVRQDQQSTSRGGRKPPIRLKRSVKTLRDLYEAQAEEATLSPPLNSPPSRPTSSNSRFRNFGSGDASVNRSGKESYPTISSDDLVQLPSIPRNAYIAQPDQPESPFTSQPADIAVTSSPNYKILGVSSSPKVPIYEDLSSSGPDQSNDTTTSHSGFLDSSSSPNVVKIATSSSYDDLPNIDPSSSPNVVKLGTSSPTRTSGEVKASSPTPRPTSSTSDLSKKRKRESYDDERFFTARAGMSNSFPSSPPVRSHARTESEISPTHVILKSSPPKRISLESSSIEDSSSVVQISGRDESNSEQSSIAETHVSLQEAISSSPAPPIQYPIVRAPTLGQFAGLVIPKRKYRLSTNEALGSRFASRLSAVPSEAEVSSRKSKHTSKQSSFIENLNDMGYADSPTLPQDSFVVKAETDPDRYEADDEVSALPGGRIPYDPLPLRSVGSERSLISSGSSSSRSHSRHNSTDRRLNTMKSFTHSRTNSTQSFRPDSSSSAVSTLIIPTWARRYYSGIYADPFQHLQGQSTASLAAIAVAAATVRPSTARSYASRPGTSKSRPDRPETSKSRNSRPSFISARSSLSNHVPAIFRPKNWSRAEARKSHKFPGIGPLVSNPIQTPAGAAIQNRQQTPLNGFRAVRPVSTPQHPADPRTHWGGEYSGMSYAEGSDRTVRRIPPPSSSSDSSSTQDSIIRYPPRINTFQLPSEWPHLHHDHRLNTGSTASRGYGFPYNVKPKWSAPDSWNVSAHGRGMNRREAQVVCFLSGFLLPPMWFIGALLPLPERPEMFHDIEKAEWKHHGPNLNAWEKSDVVTKLRIEKSRKGKEELNWQNARWWRTLNRWMCILGALILASVIVLAAIGTRIW